MNGHLIISRIGIPIVLSGTCAPSLLACSVCFGQSDSAMAQGMNMGIFTLLLVITSVLCGVAGFFVYLVRRGAQLEAASQTEFIEHRTNA